jgi:1-acyl-sn-glycerol-3-phosphate acyltransferase
MLPVIRHDVIARSYRALEPIARLYFRSETHGIERVPKTQTILVTNHDGGVLPINGICFGVHWYERFGFDRPLYVLTHDIIHAVFRPFSTILGDSGLIPADRAHMNAALAAGESVLVFPGAARESFRSWKRRREIDLGGRTGFVAQAIRWQIPITPIASVGGHDTLFVVWGGHSLARALGVPKLVRSGDVMPLLVGIPWGVWMAPFIPQFPLPAKIVNEVLEPIWLPDALGRKLRPADADNPEIVRAGFDIVLRRMREGVSRLYDQRRWPIIG